MAETNKALGCNYEAPTFGAHYPDGTCIDGYMWDLDSCDEPGGGLLHGGDQPCPWCNTSEFIEWRGVPMSGNARQRRTVRRALTKKIRAWAERRSSFPLAANGTAGRLLDGVEHNGFPGGASA